MEDNPTVGAVIAQIAPRLRQARAVRGMSLADLARASGISTSTLSRLESGQRRPSLELLLPVLTALDVDLGQIVAAPRVDTTPRPTFRAPDDDIYNGAQPGRHLTPLTRARGEPRAWTMVIPAYDAHPYLRTHNGYQWLYVLRGRLRMVLDDHDFTMTAGEAAEFDCATPHWFGATGRGSVEVLSLFGTRGERIHLRTAPKVR